MSNRSLEILPLRVLVAGGTGALGSVVAKEFVAAGARVAVTMPSGVSGSTATEGMLSVPCDVTNAAAVHSLFVQREEAWGGIDAVVNTVGGYAGGRLTDTTPETWDRMFAINLRAAFLLTREAIQSMAPKGHGRIIHITAMSGTMAAPGKIAYGSSKAALISFIVSVAEELKGTGITINGIAPGIIDTPANRAEMPDADHRSWVQPTEIARSIIGLCLPEAGHISGTILRMPGGT